MNIYADNGYLDVPKLKSQGMPFVFVTGARGTGKTYGELHDLLVNNTPFVMMRRTKTEIDFLARDEMTNPFRELNDALHLNVGLQKAGQYYQIVDRDTDGEITNIRGILIALSTVANIRGFDGSRFEELFFDEFIPERHVRPIRDEHYAFLNAVETIGRNRELQGRPPLRVFCASNSNRLDNAIYLGLNLLRKVESMKRKQQLYSAMPDRGILLVNLENSPVSEAKRETSLYRMSAGTGFERMALENKYIGESDRNPHIRRANLAEYNPLVTIGEITIYVHKSRVEYYVTGRSTGTPPVYDMSDTDKERFKYQYGHLWFYYLQGNVYFEDRLSEILLTHVWN